MSFSINKCLHIITLHNCFPDFLVVTVAQWSTWSNNLLIPAPSTSGLLHMFFFCSKIECFQWSNHVISYPGTFEQRRIEKILNILSSMWPQSTTLGFWNVIILIESSLNLLQDRSWPSTLRTNFLVQKRNEKVLILSYSPYKIPVTQKGFSIISIFVLRGW